MKSLICYSENDIRVEDIEIPSISDNEVLVRTIFCGLCITDVLKVIDPQVKKPTKLGHEVVGMIEKTGKNIKNIKKGDFVAIYHRIPCQNCIYCAHGKTFMCKHARQTNLDPQGFAEYIRLTEEHVKHNIFIIKDKNNIKNAVFTEPVATCIKAIEKMNLIKDDKVMVIGCGPMGMIFIGLLKNLYKCFVIALSRTDEKLKIAKSFGADVIINSKKEDAKKRISKLTQVGLDGVFLTFTSSETVNLALSTTREGGYVQIFGGPLKEKEIAINFDDLYKKEKAVITSYSSDPEYNKKSFYLLMDSKNNNLDFTPLISNILPIEDFKKGVDLALTQKTFKILFYFNKDFLDFVFSHNYSKTTQT